MIIKRFRPFEIVVFPCSRFLSEPPEGFINRHQLLRAQVTRSFRTACSVGGLLLTNHAVSHLDGFTAVRRLRIEHANIIAVIAVLYFFPFHWDVQFVLGHSLKGVGLRQRYPDAGFSFDLRKFDSIDKFKLIRAFDDAWGVSSADRTRARHEK